MDVALKKILLRGNFTDSERVIKILHDEEVSLCLSQDKVSLIVFEPLTAGLHVLIYMPLAFVVCEACSCI